MDVLTRWNSTFYMFQRLLKLQEPLIATIGLLHNPVNFLSEQEWDILREFCTILKPFEQITVEMSAEQSLTMSKLIVIIKGLKSVVNRIKLFISYTRRCAILDPRFKTKVFGTESTVSMVREKLEKDTAQLIISKSSEIMTEFEQLPSTSSGSPSQVNDDDDNLLWADFDKFTKTQKEISPQALAITEANAHAYQCTTPDELYAGFLAPLDNYESPSTSSVKVPRVAASVPKPRKYFVPP
ncbi:hypothetical protein NQ315_012046, partial [Exocentrus adspersus]